MMVECKDPDISRDFCARIATVSSKSLKKEAAMKKNKLSILIPSNRKWSKSLSSILKTAEIEADNIEIIIADNSGDFLKKSTLSQLFEANDRFNFKLINNPENTPPQDNWRSAITSATGSYVLFWADDDYGNTAFIDEFLEKNKNTDQKYYTPPLQQYGLGRFISIGTTEIQGSPWDQRITQHINARVTPQLVYSITPADLAKKFFLSYVKNHPLVGTFLDWHFEYFIRAWCEGENLTKGFYLYDGERWMQAQTAMDADAKQCMQYGLPYWFVAFHQLFWAVDLCHFIDSAYFPNDEEKRKTVIRAIINRNMPIMRNELASVKNHLFQNAALPQSLKKDIIALVQDANPDLEDLDFVFFRILEETSPSKAYEYREFIEKIKTQEIDSLNLDVNGKNFDETLNADSNTQNKSSFITPKVSVIIPCYNQAQFLGDSISSVLAQSFEDWECIIVNDGSPDNTSDVARKLIDKDPKRRIRLLEKDNGGLSSARNFGIERARGDYILPLDADDKIHPQFIELLLNALQKSGTDIAYTDIQHFGLQNDFWETSPFDLDSELKDNRIPYCSLYKKEVFYANGGYSTELSAYEDWDFWISALENGFRAIKVNGPYFYYRKSQTSMLVEGNKRRDQLIAQIVLRHPKLYGQEKVRAAREFLENKREIGKKILIACDYFWPSIGGVEVIAENLALYFLEHGYNVDIATRALNNRCASEYKGIRIHSIPVDNFSLPWNSQAAQELAHLIDAGDYKCAIFMADPLTWVIWAVDYLSSRTKTKTIIQPLINDDGYELWKNHPEFRVKLSSTLKKTDIIARLTRSGIDAKFLEQENIPSFYIPNATRLIDSDFDPYSAFPIDPRKPVLLRIGNLWPVKNHLGLIEVFSAYKGDAQLVIVGHPSSSEEYARQVYEAARKDTRIILIPGLPPEKTHKLIEISSIVLISSVAEVFPVVLLEAMSFGKPWISTPCSGVIQEMAGGVCVPLEKFPDVIDALIKDSNLSRALGKLGQQFWRENFSWNMVGSAWQDLVEFGHTEKEFLPSKEIVSSSIELLRKLEKRTGIVLHPPQATVLESRQDDMYGKKNPLVSVIIPTYNRPDLLIRAIRSVKEQNYKNTEIIVVNDAGKEISDIVNWLSEGSNIVYIRHGQNRKIAAARNTGLRVARGEIICYLDDDDVFLPDHIETVVSRLTESHVPFVYTEAEHVVESPELGQMKELHRYGNANNMSFSKKRLHICNYIPVNTWAHQHRILDEVGYFDESLDNHEDWDFLLRCTRKYGLLHIPQVTVQVHARISADNILRRERSKFFATFQRLYARYDDLGDPEIARGRLQMLQSLQDDANAFPSVAFSGKSIDFFGGYFAPVIKPTPNRGHFNYVVPCTSADLPALADLLTSLAQQADVLWNLIVVADLPVPDPMWCNLPMLRWQTVAQCADIEPAVAAILAEPLTGWVVVLAADKSSTWPMHAKPAYAVQHHLPANLPLPSFFTPGKNKIAVVMHIYYPELAAELFDSLANIDEPFDLFVSLVKGASDAMVSLILESYPSARIYVAPNLGRDILPFVYLLESGCLDTYTAVLKVHTQYTPQIPEFGAYVRQQLLESLLGSTARVRGIVQAFRTYRDLGMVGPRARLIDSGNAEFHWHDNAEKLLWLEGRVGVPLDLEHARFVAGTMFWFRPAALAALRGCLNPLDFEAEPLPNDGALPHALERYFGILTRGAGYLVKAVEELPT